MSNWLVNLVFFLLVLWSGCSLYSFSTFMFYEQAHSVSALLCVACQLVLELIACLVIVKNFSKLFSTALNVSILLWLVYAIFITMLNTLQPFHDLRDVVWWPLMYYLFYAISRNDAYGIYEKKITSSLLLGLFVVNVFIFMMFAKKSFMMVAMGISSFQATNQIFYIALLIPLVVLIRNLKIKYLYLLCALLCVCISFKRSPLIYSFLSFVIVLYKDFWKSRRMNVVWKFILPIFLLGAIHFGYEYIEKQTGGYLSTRIESASSDGGSGRTSIYDRVWNKYKNQGVFRQVFGQGFDGVRRNYHIWHNGDNLSAHNDFLEMLVDFGLIGLILYIIVLYQIFRVFIRSKKIKYGGYRQAMLVFWIVFIVMSMVSHLFIYPSYYAFLMMIVAITAGKIQQISRVGINV